MLRTQNQTEHHWTLLILLSSVTLALQCKNSIQDDIAWRCRQTISVWITTWDFTIMLKLNRTLVP